MHNPSYPPGCNNNMCFTQHFTCTNAPSDLSNYYLQGVNAPSQFQCLVTRSINPTISFVATLNNDNTQAQIFLYNFGQNNFAAASSSASALVRKYIPNPVCGSTLVADATSCGAGTFTWNWHNLNPAFPPCSPPPSLSPPPPPIGSSCQVFIKLFNPSCQSNPQGCFNPDTCTFAPGGFNNNYLTGVSVVSGFTCPYGLTTPTTLFQAVISSQGDGTTFINNFRSTPSVATAIIQAYMPGAPCTATYVADATQCNAGYFSWDKTTLPSVFSCPSPPPPMILPPPTQPCSVTVSLYNPLNANCADPSSSCYTASSCVGISNQLNAFYLAGVAVNIPFYCQQGPKNPFLILTAQLTSNNDAQTFLYNFGSASPSGQNTASVMVSTWIRNAILQTTPCGATFTAEASSCGLGSFQWNHFNLPGTIPACTATSPPPPPPPPPTSTSTLLTAMFLSPTPISCTAVVNAFVFYLRFSGNPYVTPTCSAASPTQLSVNVLFASVQLGNQFIASILTYGSEFLALAEVPCGSVVSVYWAATTNVYSCSSAYPSLCCAPVALPPPSPPPPPPNGPSIKRFITASVPKIVNQVAISNEYVQSFLCPSFQNASKAMFKDLGLHRGQDWIQTSECIIQSQYTNWQYGFSFSLTNYTALIIQDIYLSQDASLNLFVDRGHIICLSQILLQDGKRVVLLIAQSPQNYPLDPASPLSLCVKNPQV